MSTPILVTKLYIPPPRPRLIERLNEGLSSGCKLTLISASAGFGKTTLVGEWIASLWQRPPGQPDRNPTVQALAFQVQGNISQALVSMDGALTLAEPDGYVRIFVDEGEPIRSLIEKLSCGQDKTFPGYVDKLLAAFAQPTAVPQPKVENLQSTIIERK